eukprot:3782959-Ditylum_brightwellii.AAC.1
MKGSKKKRKETVIESPDNILLSGLPAEKDKEANKKNSTDNMLSSKGSNGGSSLYSGVIRSITNEESLNDGSKPDIKDCVYVDNDNEYAEDMTKVDNEEESSFMSEEWEWNNWATHGISLEIPGPKLEDRYNRPHSLEDGVKEKFTTALQCVIKCTAMDREFSSG